jgi:tRNA U34 2-thiouridine synthase MnmA/TrmU
MLALTPSPVWAQEATEVSNPTIRALKQRMRSRYNQMKPYYQKGMLREGNDGYVSVGSTSGLGLKEKRDLNAFVEAENRDRKTLYVEVAKALKVHPIDAAQIDKVAKIFAKEWQKSIR